MRDSKTCLNCGSQEIAGPHRIHSYRYPFSINLPGIRTATIRAYSCLECGYTQFFVDEKGVDNLREFGKTHHTAKN